MFREAKHRRAFIVYKIAMFLMLLLLLPFSFMATSTHSPLFTWGWTDHHLKYSHFPESRRLEMINETKKMFYFGYENYMNLAFPLDELNPILCNGRGPDYDNP